MAHLLVITAHADDLEFFCGGTVCRATRQRHVADLVIVTDSARGSEDATTDRRELARLRETEARAAARIIGLREVVGLGCDDGFLRDTPINQLRERLMREIRARRPDVILTFDPADATEGHPDHRRVAIAASEAARFARLPHFHPEQCEAGLQPHLTREVYYFAKSPQAADKVVDVTDYLDTQIAALLAHASQMRFLVAQALAEARALDAPVEVLAQLAPVAAGAVMAQAIRRRAAALGARHGLAAAEVFRREQLFASALLRPGGWQPQDIV